MSETPKRRQIRNTSQSAKILEYLKTGNTLTRKEAYAMFDCMTLAQRVRDLRDAGYDIKVKYLNVSKQTLIAQYYMDI